MNNEAGFDRLRPRVTESAGRAPRPVRTVRPSDPQGRRALYSVADQSPCLGAVTIDCSSCERTSVVTPRRLIGLATPSLHLPLVKRGHSSWMRCPACRKRTWVRVRLRL